MCHVTDVPVFNIRWNLVDIYMWFSTQHITNVWTLSFYCICYNPTALGRYNTILRQKVDRVKAVERF
jgi:hypothetical protein